MAMACHAAVETAISEHYDEQLRSIHEAGLQKDSELREVAKVFRDDELHHKQKGLDNGAEQVRMVCT